MEQLQVWEDEPDRWRWSYRTSGRAELVSNHSYPQRGRAEEAARHAYPDLEIDRSEVDEQISTERMWIALLALVLVAIGIGVVVNRQRRSGANEPVT